MANKLISDLVAQTTPASGDLVEIEEVSTPASKKSTLQQIFTAGKSAASEGATGVVELATSAETITGTDTARAVTPAGLQAKVTSGGTGWIPVNQTWTYASATTITVPAGAASIYSVGDKIKLTQTTVKYFYITVVANTLLTVTGGADYTVANNAITLNYYSKAVSPVGFPYNGFSLGTPTWTTTGTAFANQPVNNNWRLYIEGGIAMISGQAQCHATSGGTGVFIGTFTTGYLPSIGLSPAGSAQNFNTITGGFSYANASNLIKLAKYDGTAIATNSEYFGAFLPFRIL